jgi:hypothetical protein
VRQKNGLGGRLLTLTRLTLLALTLLTLALLALRGLALGVESGGSCDNSQKCDDRTDNTTTLRGHGGAPEA